MSDIVQKRKAKKNLGLGMLGLAFVFYFLPDFTVLDVLPDVIGYTLAYFGISQLADLSDGVAAAKKKFAHLIIFGIAKLLSVIAVYGLFDAHERPNATLSILFVFAVIEFCLLIPAITNLFDSILYLGTREESTSVFSYRIKEVNRAKVNDDGTKKFKTSYTDAVKRFTVLFIIIKNVMTVLPEFLSLAANVDVQSYTYTRYDDINYFRIIAMTVAVVFGIVWLVKIEKYFSRLKQDRLFMGRLTERYVTEVASDTVLWARRRMSIAFLLFIIGAFFTIDFYIDGNDGYNVIPDFISALAFLLGAVMITDKGSKKRKFAFASSVLYGIISTVTWIVNYQFTYEYTAKEVSRDVIANTFWLVLIAVAVLEALMFCAMLFCIMKALRDVVRNHTGYLKIHDSIDPAAKAKALHQRLEKTLLIALCVGCIASLGIPFRVFMFSSESYIADISWIVEVLLSLIFAGCFTKTLLSIKEEVNEKYSLM